MGFKQSMLNISAIIPADHGFKVYSVYLCGQKYGQQSSHFHTQIGQKMHQNQYPGLLDKLQTFHSQI
jgi:hypothetical protein